MRKTITITSAIENLQRVEQLVDEVCIKHKISSDTYGNILVSLSEAVTNAIVHGNKSNIAKSIEVGYAVDENGQLNFEVKDIGEGFDYAELPDPTLPENLEKIGGRGLFLMAALADSVTFSNNGSTVRLQFNL